MKKFAWSLVAALIPIAIGLITSPWGPPTASASTTAASWPTLEATALGATSTYLGDGTLTTTGTPSSITDSTVVTASGTITVAQRSIVATDDSGRVVLVLALLGGRQLAVTEMDPAAHFQGDTLVLRPGSSSVAGTYPVLGANQSTATLSSASHRIGNGTNVALLQRRGKGNQPNARLVTIGGCFPNPQPPGVIGSTFGPLVQGEGIITCGTSESLAEIVALYRGSTHVGTTATGSGGGTFLGINSYYGCSVISGTHAFQTDELWAVNGTVRGGAASHTSNLHCQ